MNLRLGDTGLWITVEDDKTIYGDECKFGGGKSLRDGQGQATNKKDSDSLDLIVTNALIIDWTGIYKVRRPRNLIQGVAENTALQADIGVKDGLIKGIGKGGNPDIMDGVDPDMIVGVNTEV